MRNLLIKKIYDLEETTDIRCMEDLTTWSNADLLEYYGSLRVEEYYQFEEQTHDKE